MGLSWPAPELLQGDVWDRRELHFLSMPGKELAHELRDCTRHLLWSRAGNRRADMQGLALGVDVEATSLLLRSSRTPKEHLGLLRSILSGGVVCGQRAVKAGFRSVDVCDFCNTQAAETVHHLFWECPAWSAVRSKHKLALGAW